MRGEQVLEFFERGGVWKTADEKFRSGRAFGVCRGPLWQLTAAAQLVIPVAACG